MDASIEVRIRCVPTFHVALVFLPLLTMRAWQGVSFAPLR